MFSLLFSKQYPTNCRHRFKSNAWLVHESYLVYCLGVMLQISIVQDNNSTDIRSMIRSNFFITDYDVKKHPFSTYAKFSEILTFLTPQVRVRVRG